MVSNKRFFMKFFFFFTNLYLHCRLFESLLRFTVKIPHFMDTRLIRTCHYNRQFALFLGKKSPYISPKLIPFFFLHRRLMNKSFWISNCCYQKTVHQHLFMTPTPSSVFQVFTLYFPVLFYVTLCYPVLPCVTLCYPVFPCVTLCSPVLPCVSLCFLVLLCVPLWYSVLPCFPLYCPVFPSVTLCYVLFPCVTLCSPVLFCVTLCSPVVLCVCLCYLMLLCVTLCYLVLI